MSRFKNFVKQFFLIDDSPHKVAAGAALGVFLGIVPGEGVLSTLFFSYIFRFNRVAAMAGVLATNMWMTLVVLPLAAIVGGFLFHENSNLLIASFKTHHFKSLFTRLFFFDVALPLLVGFAIVAGAIAFLIYIILYFLLKSRKKIEKK